MKALTSFSALRDPDLDLAVSGVGPYFFAKRLDGLPDGSIEGRGSRLEVNDQAQRVRVLGERKLFDAIRMRGLRELGRGQRLHGGQGERGVPGVEESGEGEAGQQDHAR